jgi:hypothetical protein
LKRIESFAFIGCGVQWVSIPRRVEIIGERAFADCTQLASVSFDIRAELRQIEAGAFSCSRLLSIRIPREVEVVGPQCFSYCQLLETITFQAGSRLRRIGHDLMSWTRVASIVLPKSVEFVSGCAFSQYCEVRMEGGGETQAFAEWNTARMRGRAPLPDFVRVDEEAGDT